MAPDVRTFAGGFIRLSPLNEYRPDTLGGGIGLARLLFGVMATR